jgi:tetratricopeptide (TPR) repeat protein
MMSFAQPFLAIIILYHIGLGAFPFGFSTQRDPSGSSSNQPTLEQSLQLVQGRLKADPQNPRLHYQLGMIHEAGNQFGQAIESYWTAVELDTNVEEYSLALASLFFHIDNDNQAIEVLQAYLEVNANSVPCLGLLGTIQLMNSRYDQVLSVAEKALALSPGYTYGYFLVGMGHKGLHQQEEAKKAFEKTIALDPEFADAYVELGLLYSKDQRSRPETGASAEK